MRGVLIGCFAEPKRPVETVAAIRIGAESDLTKLAVGELQQSANEVSADASASVFTRHEDVSNSSDFWIVGIRVDVETAHADDTMRAPHEEDDFPRAVEAIGAGSPLVH